MKKVLGYVSLVVILALIATNIFTFNYFKSQVKQMEDGVALDTFVSVLETSNNSYSIYEFAKYQYNQGAIDLNSMSTTLQNIIDIHSKLISITEAKTKTETFNELSTLTVEYLKTQQGAYVDFKSAVDLSADNFIKAGDQKLEQAKQKREQINTILQSYVK